jgi:hypothetical protein
MSQQKPRLGLLLERPQSVLRHSGTVSDPTWRLALTSTRTTPSEEPLRRKRLDNLWRLMTKVKTIVL